jgi:integrase/recombinase XerD
MATRKSNPSRKATSKRSTSQTFPRRASKTIRAAIDDFLLDRESRNFSPKTLVQHRTSLAHLANFLEKQHKVTHLSMIEAVHLRAWLVFLAKEPGVRGKSRITRTARTCRWYAQSMHAFCNWLVAEQYIEENPAERVELPKLEKPLIRIIEFEEFEALLAACAAPQEKGFIADRNAARNRAILWVLWDTGIRVGELCDLRLANFDRRQGTLIVFGKGRKERRVALGRNALRALLYYLDRWRQDAEELGETGNPNEEHIFLSEGGQALTIDLQELLGHEDISTIKNYMHLNDVNVQAQKRKFSPGDNVPFAARSQPRKQRTDFREPVKRKPRGLRRIEHE